MSGKVAAAHAEPQSSAGDMPSPRSNSFHYSEERDILRPKGAPCPVRSSDVRFSPTRTLFVRLRDRMRLYATQTRDFSDERIRDVKERDAQVYADISTKAAPDDFAVDLRKLELSSECILCSKRAACGGAYQGRRDNVFERDAEQVQALIRNSRGLILDVGCGDGPYGAVIAEGVRAGRSEYRGVDPDGARTTLLASRFPLGSYFTGTLEQYLSSGDAPAEFSHVLFLRSYNHLADPANTIALAVSRLAVGGTLLVVDNVAFALIRDRTQRARAERGPGRFEHYRNATAAEAAAVIERPELRLLVRRDVEPSGSNEWLLHYEKTGNIE